MKGSFINHSSSDDKSIKAKINQSSKAKNTDSSSNNSSSSSGSWRRGGNVSLNNHNDNNNFVNNYTKYDRIDKKNNYNNNKLTNYNSSNNNNSFNNKMISKDHHHVVDSKNIIYDLSAIIMKLKIMNQELSSLFYNDSFSCSNTSNVSLIHNQREISFNEQYHDLLLTLSMLSDTNRYTLEVSCDISIEMMMMMIMIMMTFN